MFRQADDGGARATEANAQQIGVLEREQLFESGHEFLAVRLVDAVVESFAQE